MKAALTVKPVLAVLYAALACSNAALVVSTQYLPPISTTPVPFVLPQKSLSELNEYAGSAIDREPFVGVAVDDDLLI